MRRHGMTDPAPAPRPAWQPLTFGGVAAFARARAGRVLAVLAAGATLCGLLLLGGFYLGWLPVIDKTVEALPATGEIRQGRLRWDDTMPRVLAQSSRLQFAVNPLAEAAFGQESDVRVELRADSWLICGWLGCWSQRYPENWVIAVNRPDVLPAWGAWRPFVLWGVFGAGVIWVLACWLLLATFGAVPLRLLAFFLDRALTLGAAWRLLAVAWIPGGLLFALAVFLYGVQQLHLAGLALVALAHPLAGMIYALGALARQPRLTPGATSPRGNPFQGTPSSTAPSPPGKN
jgi:hypothetical protein